MNELALFAGAGGGILGGVLCGWRTVCAVEIDPYCREVLLRRQRDGLLPLFPIWDDIKSFDGTAWAGAVDIVTAGFPCQPFSVAGQRKGEADERNLWPETARVIGEVRPRWCLLENVPALLTHGYFGRILSDLAACGYDTRWDCIPAGNLGAHFWGDRVFVGATRTPASSGRRQGRWALALGANQWGRDEFEGLVRMEIQHGVPTGSYGRISDGVAHRVDRLRALGNGQVPAVARLAWELLK